MPLIENGRAVADPWVSLADDAPLTPDSHVIVSFARWQAEREALSVRNAPLGVRLPSNVSADAIAPDLERFALVAVEFPKFRDGRGFSTARALRERYGYTGEIRAVGHVIADQYPLLVRCGVSTVEVPEGANVETWARTLNTMTVAYQAGLSAEEPLSLLRRRVTAA
ncbi:MAG TPA: DUF934 domain-containing protein [Azospirillum sp.]|nr:DUF934 domain-containing protein [Azospirillum sp.]